jgi:hypothetical protein
MTVASSAITEQPIDLRQTAEQRPPADVVADRPCSDKQVERSSLDIADGTQFRVHAAFGATDLASTPPFFAAMLIAARCAFTYVAANMTVFFSRTRQPGHHPCKGTFLAPTLPPALERLVRTVGCQHVSPAQPIAIEEDNPAQYPSVIYPPLAVRL